MTGELSPEQIRDIFTQQIVPLWFPDDATPTTRPTLVLLGGQPGAGKSRAVGKLLRDHGDELVVLSGDDLRPFHPDYRDLVTQQPTQAPGILAKATSEWVRASIDRAREQGRSLLLEGTFHNPDVVASTAQRFAEQGYRVQAVTIATPRHESLLSATSRYLIDRAGGHPARFTSMSVHDRGYEGTHQFLEGVGQIAAINRVTILNRTGEAVYDNQQRVEGEPGGFEDAATHLERARSAPMGNRATMEWLSELARVTNYARSSGQIDPQLGELLVDLNERALREVIPALPFPEGSEMMGRLEQRVASDLVTVRRAVETDPQLTDVTSPSAATSGRGLSR